MEVGQDSLHWERRAPDWPVAVVSGFAAGAVLMMLDVLWSTVLAEGGPWRTSRMIAPIFLGPEVAQSSGFHFSIPVVAVALGVHYVLGIVSGLILATIMSALHLDATAAKAVVTGAVFGAVIYLVNFHVMASWFPWLAEMRGWPTLAAHLVFGIVAASLNWKLARTPKEARRS